MEGEGERERGVRGKSLQKVKYTIMHKPPTMEPLNNGHIGTGHLSFIERLSSLWRLKCTSIIEKGPQSVSFIERLFSLRKLKCTSIIENGPKFVLYIVLLCPLFRVSIIRGSIILYV